MRIIENTGGEWWEEKEFSKSEIFKKFEKINFLKDGKVLKRKDTKKF